MKRRNVQEPIFLDLNAKPNSNNAVVTASELATSNSKMLAAFAKVKEVADEMMGMAIYTEEPMWVRENVSRIYEAIKEFVKGEV